MDDTNRTEIAHMDSIDKVNKNKENKQFTIGHGTTKRK